MVTKRTSLFARTAVSPECSKLIEDMMNAASSGREAINPEDLANAAFSIMCFGLAKIRGSRARDELLRALPQEAVEAVTEIVRIAEKITHEQKKH